MYKDSTFWWGVAVGVVGVYAFHAVRARKAAATAS